MHTCVFVCVNVFLSGINLSSIKFSVVVRSNCSIIRFQL